MPDSVSKEFISQVADFTLQVCTPICWHDRTERFPKVVTGASCFFLRLPKGLIGITAAHVIDAYEDARLKNSNLVCQLRLMEFFPGNALIDIDRSLDIATFALSESQLLNVAATPIDCTSEWPPPPVSRGGAVSFCGFPESMILTAEDKSAIFQAYGGLSIIEDFSDREILLTYDPLREKPLAGPSSLPPLGFNMSGCSGGPVLMHGLRNHLHRWFPVGLIVSGAKRDGTAVGISRGIAEGFDTIRVRRIHLVNQDGSISRDNGAVGWLPGRVDD